MPRKYHGLLSLVLAFSPLASAFLIPPSLTELRPLLDGLTQQPQSADNQELRKRVPLSTNDNTVSPLVDLQVFAPPVVPRRGTKCTIELLKHSFGDGSYNQPAVVSYTPPSSESCGKIGQWAAISLNLSVYSFGTQYDRLSTVYLSHTEIWRTSSAEPTKTGTIWNTVKDVTHFAPLFATEGDLMMDFSNIIAPELLLDGVFNGIFKFDSSLSINNYNKELSVTLTAIFYAPTDDFPTPRTSDLIIPLSNLSPTVPNVFSVSGSDSATTHISLPANSVEVFVEIFCSGNANEEFWYTNTPDEFLPYFPASTGLIGKGPFREVQISIDGQLAGVVWPYAVIYTGGITPSNWRPLASYGAYDAPTYWIDISPFLPILLSTSNSHSITLRVLGQGMNSTVNDNWFLSGSVHVRQGTTKTTGRMRSYNVTNLEIESTGGSDARNATVWTSVRAKRTLNIESELNTSEGKKIAVFQQDLLYVNTAKYVDDGWIQWINQTTSGTTTSTHGGIQVMRDAFSYPLSVFSNYSAYIDTFGSYGSSVNQTYARALQPPTGSYGATLSMQHAAGDIEMDDWPGLRHAIKGTGDTEQKFAFADGRGETYFRDIAAKNDGWVKDVVWGSLRDGNPPVPQNQVFGPGGGPGFRR